jgi:hypothetical protein
MKDYFQELLQVLPELVSKEILTENLADMIGTLEMLLPRINYKQY